MTRRSRVPQQFVLDEKGLPKPIKRTPRVGPLDPAVVEAERQRLQQRAMAPHSHRRTTDLTNEADMDRFMAAVMRRAAKAAKRAALASPQK